MVKYWFWIVVVFLLFFRFYTTRPVYNDGDKIRISTKVLSEPIVFERQQYLKIKGLKVYLPKYPEIYYGDRIVVEGTVYKDTLKSAKLVGFDPESKEFLYGFRNKIISFFKTTLPEPYSSLVSGIVIGSKQMPESFWDKLRETGTAHIVVASGTNVTLLSSMLILSLTYFMKRKYVGLITIAVILIYVVLSGFDAPIVRASIMGIILLFGQLTGRITDTWRILIYTSISMMLFKPEWITDLGFILSFVATSSLLLFQKRVDNYFWYLPNILREGFTTSIAAQIGVAPIIYATFGQFNILSPIINALVLWTIPYIMVVGAIAGIIGLIVPLVGRLILFILFPLLWYFEKVISIF